MNTCTVIIDGNRAKFERGHRVSYETVGKIVKRRDPVVHWYEPNTTRQGRLLPGEALRASDGLVIGTKHTKPAGRSN